MKKIASCIAFAGLVGFAPDANAGHILFGNDYLFQGQQLVSPGCYYYVKMQHDGNLVLRTGGGGALWASNTQGASYAHIWDTHFGVFSFQDTWFWLTDEALGDTVHVQNDGNLVMYSSNGNVRWASNTWSHPPISQSPCSRFTEKTVVFAHVDLPGGDLTSFNLSEARPNWCGHHCAQNSACKSYTYVPPGVQGPLARCWLKSSVPQGVLAPGMVCGIKSS